MSTVRSDSGLRGTMADVGGAEDAPAPTDPQAAAPPVAEDAAFPAPAPSPQSSSGSSTLERKNDPMADMIAKQAQGAMATPGQPSYTPEQQKAAAASYEQAKAETMPPPAPAPKPAEPPPAANPPVPIVLVAAEGQSMASPAASTAAAVAGAVASAVAKTATFFSATINVFLAGQYFTFYAMPLFAFANFWSNLARLTEAATRPLGASLFGVDQDTSRAVQTRDARGKKLASTPTPKKAAAPTIARSAAASAAAAEDGTPRPSSVARTAAARTESAQAAAALAASARAGDVEGVDVAAAQAATPMAVAEPAPGTSANVLRYRDLMADAGKRYGVSPALLAAVMQQESGGNPKAASRTNDAGLMQINRDAHPEFYANAKDPLAPKAQIDYGASILAQNLKHFGGDVKKAVAAYNAGIGGVERALKRGLDPSVATSTPRYVSSVVGLIKSYEPSFSQTGSQTGSRK